MDTCFIFSNKMASEEVCKRGDLFLQLTGNDAENSLSQELVA